MPPAAILSLRRAHPRAHPRAHRLVRLLHCNLLFMDRVTQYKASVSVANTGGIRVEFPNIFYSKQTQLLRW